MIEDQLSAYLTRQWGEPVAISGIKRFHGGAARQTYRFDATVAGAAKRGLVLRRDPPSSLIDTDRRIEFEAIRSAWNAGLPVPEVLFIETGSEAFGSPAFLMAEVPGVHAAGLFDADPYGEARGAVGTQLFSILGRIHSMDPQSVAHVLDRPDPADAWAVRLDHWRAAVAAHNSGPEPVIAAGFRWLERNPPPPPQRLAVIHGDFRSGNFLVDDANDIKAVVDWEMVHIGDPLEDLGWVCDSLWSHGNPDHPAGTLPLADCIAAWEAASGLRCDPVALRWWRVFAQVTGLAIWISSAHEVASGRITDPVSVFAAIYPYRYHSRALARTLKELAA